MNTSINKIAVVGMACKFPGAINIAEYWNNLILGKETLTNFTDEEIEKIEPYFEKLKNNPDYIRVRGALKDIDKFDAAFFGMTPTEASQTDPQQRIWLETVWEAFEHAGCDPFKYPGAIGVFAGGGMSSYLISNILRDPKRMENYLRPGSADATQIFIGNDISYIPTKAAYHFNLKGPAVFVQTACSTSLVAIIQACQSLYSFESDICLAGGIKISVPQEKGYVYQEGSIASPDGHCRPFDAQAKGTVGGNGVGVVVLKRLEDALRDNDTIYALADGWALNNDGNNKVSFAAPSIDGQAEVIMMAQTFADISPEEISYVEAHGTATQLGDPIEIAGLTKAFRAKTDKKQFCGIGSVKSNIGHTDAAAGVASFIKICLSAYYKKIPPSLHYTAPNPHIDFANSPFYVLNQLKEWTEDKPLIMGVSSFGIGGTNAHVIIEEAPDQAVSEVTQTQWPELIILSAKSQESLNRRKQELPEFLKYNADLNICDIAGTLAFGRNHMQYRSYLVASSVGEIISGANSFTDGKKSGQPSKVAYIFPGQGAQYVKMGFDLYNKNTTFRNILDHCFKVYKTETGEDLKAVLFDENNTGESENKLASTELTQPALFIIEYGLAKVLEQLEVKPDYLIGHSIGEYTAACLAGVFDVDTALKIVIKRGHLMRKMPNGNMMAVRAGIEKLKFVSSSLFEIAADNSSESCTISFRTEDNEKVIALLEENDISYITLNTSHAFHSASFDPILSEFRDYVNQFSLKNPELPFISCLSGTFITNAQATSGAYWAQQLRNTVHFREGISMIAEHGDTIFLEVGPNTHLSSLVRQFREITDKNLIISTLGKSDNTDERYKVLASLGKMFNAGLGINFETLRQGNKFRKIALPTYPFEKKRHWIEPDFSTIFNEFPGTVKKSDNDTLPADKNTFHEKDYEDRGGIESMAARIAGIWKTMMGRDDIGYDDDFFDIGGHSLLALQILTRVKEDLSLKITLKEFLDNPTINKLITKFGVADIKSDQKSILLHDIDISDFPLSYMQKKLWIISKLDGTNPAYNIPFTYRFKGNLNIDIFKEALNLLFKKHFVIFSRFKEKDDNPYCEIIPVQVEIEFLDYSSEGNIRSEENILKYIGRESRKLFDLETGPLYRLYLFKQDNSQYFFHATIHHIIFDGWSFSVFVNDLRRIYDSLILNKELSVADLKDYYFNYARDLKNTESASNDQTLTGFWKESLIGCSPLLNFPYDLPRKDVASGFGEKLHLKLPYELTARLKSIAKKERATPFATLLSLMGILFQRYSGENDFCIGIHVANRPTSSLERIFGMFVNTIPVRFDIDENQKFTSYINVVKNSLLESIAHQELPFEKIVEAVNPERYPNVNPIFQVAVQWITYSSKPLEFVGFSAEKVDVEEGISPFDITFNLWENGGRIEGEVEYNIDILKRDTIVRLVDSFISLAQSAVENPDKAISEIPLISENDQNLLCEFNRTEVAVPACLVHNLFEEQALKNPSKRAVVSGTSSLTYKDLDEKSNQLAWHLLSLGVKGGDVVGICLERTLEMVVSVLGVLKAGCCYLPMDPMFPAERLSYMYEDSGAKVLISQSSLSDMLHHFPDTKMVMTDTDRSAISSNGTGRLDLIVDTQSLAYIIYTSGSTGKPKGVKVHHQAVVNFLQSMSKRPGISANDRLLAVTTLSFDISVLEVFLPLTFGAEVVIADTNDIFDGQKLSKLLELNEITILQATPATWNILLGSGWAGKKNLKALCGGEAILPGLVKELLPKVESLWDMYGPTETTVWSTCNELTDSEPPILIGTPIDNTVIHILDRNSKMLPVGVIGEVCIGGLGVTKGYHNRPDLTAEKFIPFENGEIIYKTGDLGRYLSDGNLELFGRSDNQIKLRGFRIEPGEIESLLSRLPGVKEAVVKVHKFGENDERLVAFLNVESGNKLTQEEIAESLSKDLPGYMIPSFFQMSVEFPRLPNGKINKKALLFEINESKKQSEIDFDSLSATQKKLVHIWEDILKTKNINTSKSFFDVGGNSLLVIRILNKIKEDLGFKMTFKSFITFPTILLSANYIDSQLQPSNKAIELVHLTQTTNLPLTQNQKRLWLISKLLPDVPSYIIPFTYKFCGVFNHKIFEKTLRILFDRHYIVFSVIREDDGKPCFDIVPGEVGISFIDYTELLENEKTEKVDAIIAESSRKIFDLKNGPLFRIYLIKTSSEEHYFHMSIHHIIFDGWSWGVFVRDLKEIYNSLLKGIEPDLKEIRFQQYDYAQWEQSSESLKQEEESKEFWEAKLNGCSSVLNFPYDFQRTNKTSGKGDSVSLKLSQNLSEKLRKISKSEGASLFATMLGIFGMQMHKYSAEDDLNIGLPIAFRPHSCLENIFGMFVNTVVVRLIFGKDLTFREIVRQTNDEALNAIAHQDLPFEKVVELVNPERSFNTNPLFQVALDWQNNLGGVLSMEGIKGESVKVNSKLSSFDITLYLSENDGRIEGEVEYNVDILKRDTIVRLVDSFISLAQSAVENPDKAISEIPLISENDQNLLCEFNRTEVAVPACLVHNLFEEQALKNPSKRAVVSGNLSLTYKSLDERSNQLARHLLSLGVKGGDVVGIWLERTMEMVVSVLGVLKAGCCYLPMDPMFPAERLSYMYEDSGAKVLISQSSLSDMLHHFPDTKVVMTDTDRSVISSNGTGRLDLIVDTQSLAYIIYTSGSTGKPKGVKVHHQAVVNFLQSMSKRPGISANDRLLAVTTLSFDISVLEVFLPLTFGAEVVIANTNDIFDGQKLSKLLELNEITILQATPATWNILLGSGWAGKKNLKALCGGEAILPGLVKELLPKVESLWDMYGPTETTVWSTCNELTDSEPPILIGTPIDNTVIHILDRNSKMLPVGVIGEVCIGGLGVTKGYHNRPDLTAEKFIPFENGEIIYKTGDLGRYLSDGKIELFGRSDNQIKLRGFRIEPGEIESLLSRFSGVKEAVVKVHKFGENDERLVAFLNVEAGYKLNQAEVAESLSKDLPGYMLPSFYQISEDFPRLPNGKINKKALIFKIEESNNKKEIDFDSLTLTQTKLVHIWENILKTGNINPSVSFFNNGGTSILAITLANAISKEFNVIISLPLIFEYPTIKGQSEFISGNTENKDLLKKQEIVKNINSKKNINFKKRH